MTPTRNDQTTNHVPLMREPADQLVPQSVIDVALHRVRLPGFYSTAHAQAVVAQAPDELSAIQVGVEPSGQGVFALFWNRDHVAFAGPDFGSELRLAN